MDSKNWAFTTEHSEIRTFKLLDLKHQASNCKYWTYYYRLLEHPGSLHWHIFRKMIRTIQSKWSFR